MKEKRGERRSEGEVEEKKRREGEVDEKRGEEREKWKRREERRGWAGFKFQIFPNNSVAPP